MMKYLEVVKAIDLFGVTHKIKISNKESVQKSFIGGFASLLIYGICFAYFIYILVIWQNGKILPRSTSSSKVSNYTVYQAQDDMLSSFVYWRYDQSLIDPFDPQDIILIPLQYTLLNGIPGKPVNMIKENPTIMKEFNTTLITVSNFTLAQNANYDADLVPNTDIALYIVPCQTMYLKSNQKCANQSQIDKFFNQGTNYIRYSIYLKQFNPESRQVETVDQSLYIYLTNTQGFQAQILYNPAQIAIDTGLIFQAIENIQILSNYDLLTQTVPTDSVKKVINVTSYASFYQRLNPLLLKQIITYPKLAELLAMVGSISSTLLMMSYLITMLNEYLLDERLIQSVIQIQSGKEPDDNLNFAELLKACRRPKGIEELQQYKDKKVKAENQLQLLNIIKEIWVLQQFLENKFGDDFQKSSYRAKKKEKQKFDSLDLQIVYPLNNDERSQKSLD